MLAATVLTGHSQSLRLDLDNVPLNRVLAGLNVAISFDDKALSAYSVSVAQSFDTPESAIEHLLKDKPFRVEKIEDVYVIVPHARKRNEAKAVHPFAEANRYLFRGIVLDKDSPAALEYAAVSLLRHDGDIIVTGVSAQDGTFGMESREMPAMIQISYLGYESLLKNIYTAGDLGIFLLKSKEFQLGETVVAADKKADRGINRATWLITPQMRAGALNAIELLDRIPGVLLDEAMETVLVNHQANVLMVVDGIEHKPSYLKHLSPHRVDAVEIINAVSGRYVSDDYAAIINFVLKKDYRGYDLNAFQSVSLNLSGNNTNSAGNNSGVGLSYSAGKINLSASWSYDADKREIYSDKFLRYDHLSFVSLPSDVPNNLYRNSNHTLNGGLSFRLSGRQLIGVQTNYLSGSIYSKSRHVMQYADSLFSDYRLTNVSRNLTKAKAFTGMLYYQAQFINRLHLYADLSYNYYYNQIENEYHREETADLRYDDYYNEYKNHTVANLEARYILSDAISAEAGYSNIRREYASTDSRGIGFLDYTEQRNKGFAYLSFYPLRKMEIKAGIVLEQTLSKDRDRAWKSSVMLPLLLFNYRISNAINLRAGYHARQSHPSLYQLSPMSIVVDTFMTQSGNPALKSSVKHNVLLEIDFANRLKLSGVFNYTQDGISELYNPVVNKFYRTFNNVDFREYNIQISYDRELDKYFRFKNSLMFYREEAMHRRINNTHNGLMFFSEINYYNAAFSFGIQLGYYNNMRKNIIWQGFQMSGSDHWNIALQKGVWNDRIALALSYTPPFLPGVRYNRIKEIKSLIYNEKTVFKMDSYRHMLLLKINVNIGSWGVTKSEQKAVVTERERERPPLQN
jgi:hypothetical protein